MAFETLVEKAHDVKERLRPTPTVSRLGAVEQLGKQFAIGAKQVVIPEMGVTDIALHALVATNPILAMVAPGLIERGPEIKTALKQLVRGRAAELQEETVETVKDINQVLREADAKLARIEASVDQVTELTQEQTEQLPDPETTERRLDELEQAIRVQAKSQQEEQEKLNELIKSTTTKLDEVSEALTEAREIKLDEDTIEELKSETRELKVETKKQTERLEDLAKYQKAQKEELQKHTRGFLGHGLLPRSLLLATLLGGLATLLYKRREVLEPITTKFAQKVSPLFPSVAEQFEKLRLKERLETIKEATKERLQPVTERLKESKLATLGERARELKDTTYEKFNKLISSLRDVVSKLTETNTLLAQVVEFIKKTPHSLKQTITKTVPERVPIVKHVKEQAEQATYKELAETATKELSKTVKAKTESISETIKEQASERVRILSKEVSQAADIIKEKVNELSPESKVNIASEVASFFGPRGVLVGTGLRSGYYLRQRRYGKAITSLLYLTPLGTYLALYDLVQSTRQFIKRKQQETRKAVEKQARRIEQAGETLQQSVQELSKSADESTQEGGRLYSLLTSFFKRLSTRVSKTKETLEESSKRLQQKLKSTEKRTSPLAEYVAKSVADVITAYSTTAKMASGLAEGKLGRFIWGYLGTKLPILYYPVETLKLLTKLSLRTIRYTPEITRVLIQSSLKLVGSFVESVFDTVKLQIRFAGIATRWASRISSYILRTTTGLITSFVGSVRSLFDKESKKSVSEVARDFKNTLTSSFKGIARKFGVLLGPEALKDYATRLYEATIGKFGKSAKEIAETVTQEVRKTKETTQKEFTKTLESFKSLGREFAGLGKSTLTIIRKGLKATLSSVVSFLLPEWFGRPTKTPEQESLEKIAENTQKLVESQVKETKRTEEFRKKEQTYWDKYLSTLKGIRSRLGSIWRQLKSRRFWDFLKTLFVKIWSFGSNLFGGLTNLLLGGGILKLGKSILEKTIGKVLGRKVLRTVGKKSVEVGEKVLTKEVAKATEKLATKEIAKVTETTAKEVGKELLTKEATKTVEKLATKEATKVAEKASVKEATKLLSKTGLKSLLKKIPLVSVLTGAGFATQRALHRDWLGALGELASGFAATLPVVGTATSLAIDASLAVRDLSQSVKQVKEQRPARHILPTKSVPKEVQVTEYFKTEHEKEHRSEERLAQTLREVHKGSKEAVQAIKESTQKVVQSTAVLTQNINNVVTTEQRPKISDIVASRFKEVCFYQPKI